MGSIRNDRSKHGSASPPARRMPGMGATVAGLLIGAAGVVGAPGLASAQEGPPPAAPPAPEVGPVVVNSGTWHILNEPRPLPPAPRYNPPPAPPQPLPPPVTAPPPPPTVYTSTVTQVPTTSPPTNLTPGTWISVPIVPVVPPPPPGSFDVTVNIEPGTTLNLSPPPPPPPDPTKNITFTLVDSPLGLDGPWSVGVQNKILSQYAKDNGISLGEAKERISNDEEAQGEALGYLLVYLENAAAKPRDERTAEEQAALNWLAQKVKERRIDAAQGALAEYEKWKNDPCNYPGAPPCGTAFSQLFSLPDPPDLETLYANSVAAQLAGFSGVVVSSIAAGVGLAALFTAVGKAGAAGAMAAYFGVSVPAGGIAIPATTTVMAGPLAVVAAAAIVGAMEAVSVAEAEELPGKLREAVADASNAPPPDVENLFSTEDGVGEITAALMLAALGGEGQNDGAAGRVGG